MSKNQAVKPHFTAVLLRMDRRIPALVATALLLAGLPQAQAERPRIHALTDVRIVPAPGQLIESGTIVLRDGFIEAIGRGVQPPPDAEIIKGEAGWTVYPSFIDAAARLGLEEPQGRGAPAPRGREAAAPRGAPHELPPVRPQHQVLDEVDFSQASMARHRRLGFAMAHVLPQTGVFRGESAILVLRDGPAVERVAAASQMQVVALERQSFMARQYPSSRMGAMAVVRQALLDADRQARWSQRHAARPAGLAPPPFRASDAPLQAVLSGQRPVLFVSTAGLDPRRFAGITSQFGLSAMLLAQDLGDRTQDLVAGGMPVLMPLKMPAAPALDSDDAFAEATLAGMQARLQAPTLLARLDGAGVRVALVTQGMEDPGKLYEQLGQLVDGGLDPDLALAALTTVPAELLGLAAVTGTLAPGKQANLFIVEGELFGGEPKLRHLFVQGYHEVVRPEESGARGRGGRPGARSMLTTGEVY